MKLAILAAVLAGMATSGCTTPSQTRNFHSRAQVVAVADIIGSIKCAFALALNRESADPRKRLEGRVAKLEFVFKIVDTSENGVAVDGEGAGPFVFALGSGAGSILPSFSASVKRTNTITTRIHARLGLEHISTAICDAVPNDTRAAYGFESWLANVVAGLDAYRDYPPHGVVDSVEYDGNFAVLRKAGAGLKFDVVFFGGSADTDTTREDIQQVKMTIQAPDATVNFPQVVAAMAEPAGPDKPPSVDDLGPVKPIADETSSRAPLPRTEEGIGVFGGEVPPGMQTH